jgi:ribonuclease Z
MGTGGKGGALGLKVGGDLRWPRALNDLPCFGLGRLHTKQSPCRAKEGVQVTAVEVDHRPVRFAYGFVFETGGLKLAFSGDTAYCPALIEAARGADVLVHECFIHDVMRTGIGNRTEAGLCKVASYHTLSSEVGKVAAAIGVRCLVLNHFVPVCFDKSGLLAEVRRDYAGPVVLGEDLLKLDMDTGQISFAGLVLGLPTTWP